MPDAKTYAGSCHCGAVRYKATTDFARVIECNCSMCSRAGTLLTFVSPEQFELVAGENASTDYVFNKHVIHHRFCSTCGIKAYAEGKMRDGTAMFAVNVRCLEGVDPSQLTITKVDGRSF